MNYFLYHKLKYVLHLLGWAFLYILPYLFSFEGLPNAFNLFSNPGDYIHLLSFIFLIGFAYVDHLLFVPKYYLKRKYILYSIIVAASFWLVIHLPIHLLSKDILNGAHPRSNGRPQPFLFGRNYTILLFIGSVFTSLSIYTTNKMREIKQEKLNAELSLLRAQINPHFLFNTLNSIYALIINKDDKAADAIVHLSELMRYTINEVEGDFVSLDREVEYIKHYLALQEARLGDTVDISCDISGDFGNKKIAPLILITFIENAFKHGVNPNENSKIKIAIKIDENSIGLLVQNNHVTTVSKEGGVGLKNIYERLKLLYPTNHTLAIDDNKYTYSVNLEIQL